MPTWTQEDYIQAFRFAAQAHLGQTYPGTDLPYRSRFTSPPTKLSAMVGALRRILVEDTSISFEQMADSFGLAVAQGVLALSKDKSLPRAEQMPDCLHRIKQQPREIWMVMVLAWDGMVVELPLECIEVSNLLGTIAT
ncbi:MAG: hypothetical protein F6K14_33990 [Symploca sp. SIO2C1]|nr:hypothetical protein [Symploca sp. SIO2C1]